MKKQPVIKLVFIASSTSDMKFLDVYEKVSSDKYLLSRLLYCKTWHTSECAINKIVNSRCELLFNDLDETGYRDLWDLLGREVTSYSSIKESNLNLTLF